MTCLIWAPLPGRQPGFDPEVKRRKKLNERAMPEGLVEPLIISVLDWLVVSSVSLPLSLCYCEGPSSDCNKRGEHPLTYTHKHPPL